MSGGSSRHRPIALRAGRVLDPLGGIASPGVVVADGPAIAELTDEVPSGADLIDLGDVTLLPGLIDTHTHMLLQPDDRTPPAIVSKTSAYRVIEGVAAARKALLAGFTTVRDLDNEGARHGDTALRDAINEGLVTGPTMLVATDAITIDAGAMTHGPGVNPELELPDRAAKADTANEMIQQVRRQVRHGADWIKVYATSGLRPIDPVELTPIAQFDTAEIARMVTEARRFGKDVAAHAYGGDGATAAVDAGVRSIEHGVLLDEAALETMLDRETYWVPTLGAYAKLPSTPLHDAIQERHRLAFRAGIRLGVRIAFGTDVGSFPHGEQIDEFDLMVSYGMSPLTALRSATVVAAELLRRSGLIGTIRPGATADLIAVEGDPLEDIGALRNVIFVMRLGHVVRDDRGHAPSRRA